MLIKCLISKAEIPDLSFRNTEIVEKGENFLNVTMNV